MRFKGTLAVAGVLTVGGAGAALASHVTQVDPATVPTGFLAAHNKVEGIRVSSIARAVDDGRADVFIQHARLAPNEATGWHTHPGPVLVEVVRGSVVLETKIGDLEVGIREGTAAWLDVSSRHGRVHNALETTDSPELVIAYYEGKLAEAGWKRDIRPTITQYDLYFTIANCCYFGGVTVDAIPAGQGVTTVNITDSWSMGCG